MAKCDPPPRQAFRSLLHQTQCNLINGDAKERSRCVGPICAVSRTGSCSPRSKSVVTLSKGARSHGDDS
ncbi:hypothetical protein E5288_WYG012964 [Bos mutus]|uniref:Uncharacterized protein n=1 Tax=Bos mutus TaxID=72004 RepID=A0A6B0RA64_9CETA|nr:hypothetical protein [Bos mutus]